MAKILLFSLWLVVSSRCASSASLLDAVLTPVLNTVVPKLALEPCTLNVDMILSVLLAKSGPTQCNMCDVVADLTDGITSIAARSERLATDQLIELHCLRAKSTDIFRLDVSSSANDSVIAPFDRNAPFGFLLHGFTDRFPGLLTTNGQGWMQNTILNWAKQGINVCAVDWGQLSLERLNYFVVSQKSTQRVAEFLTTLLLTFEKLGMDLAKTTVAGHSLGAQIAGKTGAMLKSSGKTLGSIYGLDPAGPCYTFPCNVDEKYRLDASDANYVQCIHSNAGILGQIPRCGCSDIYLNSGVVQPRHIDPITAHQFSTFLFDWTLDALNQCPSSDGKELVGVHNTKTCGTFKVVTRGDAPYCEKSSIGKITGLFA